MDQQNKSPEAEQIATLICERGVRVCPAAIDAGALLRAEDRSLSSLREDGDDAGEQLFRLVTSARNAMERPYL